MSEQTNELEVILDASGNALPESILDLQAFLDNSPLFAALDPDARRALAQTASLKALPAGEVYIREGTRGDTFAIIKRGRLAVDATFAGQTRRLAVLGPGSVVGEVAVLMGTPRTATVTAEVDTELFEFHHDDVAPLFEQFPDLRGRLTQLVESRSDETIRVFLGKSQ
ncbi:MAG: cyclic nucleotide-binding domain-containing protein [Candidatus Dadabacteria bacterium]|nr:MAG: cyclic nucleotide-binding domain-containing protein [Candidatus Dadabacteria bacterium]